MSNVNSTTGKPKVLIVGGGPVGLALCLSLLKNGVQARLLERNAEFHKGSRGQGIQPRTLEIERFLGVLDDVQKDATTTFTRKFYDENDPYRVIKAMTMIEPVKSTPGIPFGQPILLPQHLHESVFRKHIQALGGRVDTGVTFTGLTQDDHSVTVHLSYRRDGKEYIENETYSYVVGTDGAHSSVRKALGLNFIGETREEERMFIVDCTVDGVEENGLHMWGGESGRQVRFGYTGQPKGFQVVFGGPKTDFEALRTQDRSKLQEVINTITKREDIIVTGVSNWQGDWRANIRQAEHFRKGRVFIAGDAGHAHSPAGGQGLNSGIMDAFNLGWKLALAVKGVASAALLDSYEIERFPVIVEMIKTSTRIHDQEVAPALRAALKGAQAGGNVQQQGAGPVARTRKLFQLEVNYRWSNVVFDERFEHDLRAEELDVYGVEGHDVRAGDRAPDAPNLTREGDGTVTRLFDLFCPDMHTVLLFSPGGDHAAVVPVLEYLEKVHAAPIQHAVITGGGASSEPFPALVRLVLKDAEGHAYTGYGCSKHDDELTVVIVRPDGVIGAVCGGVSGVQRYFELVFNK